MRQIKGWKRLKSSREVRLLPDPDPNSLFALFSTLFYLQTHKYNNTLDVELKERIDALCRCYEEVSVRALTVTNAFKEAEDKMVDEAKRAIGQEKKRLEIEMKTELVKLQRELLDR